MALIYLVGALLRAGYIGADILVCSSYRARCIGAINLVGSSYRERCIGADIFSLELLQSKIH